MSACVCMCGVNSAKRIVGWCQLKFPRSVMMIRHTCSRDELGKVFGEMKELEASASLAGRPSPHMLWKVLGFRLGDQLRSPCVWIM